MSRIRISEEVEHRLEQRANSAAVDFQSLRRAAAKTLKNSLTQLNFDENAGSCRCSKISAPCMCCAIVTLLPLGMTQDHKLCAHFRYLAAKRVLLLNNLTFSEPQKPPLLNLLESSSQDLQLSVTSPPQICLTMWSSAPPSPPLLAPAAGRAPGDSTRKSSPSPASRNLSSPPPRQQKRQKFPALNFCLNLHNLSYSVDVSSAHKTHFKGCAEFLVFLHSRVEGAASDAAGDGGGGAAAPQPAGDAAGVGGGVAPAPVGGGETAQNAAKKSAVQKSLISVFPLGCFIVHSSAVAPLHEGGGVGAHVAAAAVKIPAVIP